MLPKTTPQQRARFYGDVEDLISPGFLSHNVKVGRSKFALRTLGPGDLYLLRYRVGDDLEDWQTWALASSIWMINGVSLLGEHNVTPRIYKMLSHLPRRANKLLFSTFLGLVFRQGRAEDAVEAYMYEGAARTRWRSLGGDMGAMTGGVPGAEVVGRNLVQQIWTLFNEIEDQKETFQTHWEGFKLVASSNSPKGVRKIDEKDSQRQREEDERRQSVMDRYYYYRMGLVDREGFVKNKDRDLIGSQVGGPKSVEQLEDEMRRWVSGEWDEHDRIVEGYKQRILDRQDEAEREREERRRRLAAEAEQRLAAGFEATPLVGYTQEQMEAIIAQRRPGQRSGARFIYDDDFQKAQQSTMRHIHRADTGNLEVRQGRLVDTRADQAQNQRNLQSMIEGRQVAYGAQPQQPQRPAHISQSEWDEYKDQINPAAFGGQTKE